MKTTTKLLAEINFSNILNSHKLELFLIPEYGSRGYPPAKFVFIYGYFRDDSWKFSSRLIKIKILLWELICYCELVEWPFLGARF